MEGCAAAGGEAGAGAEVEINSGLSAGSTGGFSPRGGEGEEGELGSEAFAATGRGGHGTGEAGSTLKWAVATPDSSTHSFQSILCVDVPRVTSLLA